MTGDEVAASGNFADKIGTLASKPADEEKGCGRVVLLQQIEECRSHGGIGTIVEGDGEIERRGSAADRWTEKLRARLDSTIGNEAGGSSKRRRSGDEPGIHRAILACAEAAAQWHGGQGRQR